MGRRADGRMAKANCLQPDLDNKLDYNVSGEEAKRSKNSVPSPGTMIAREWKSVRTKNDRWACLIADCFLYATIKLPSTLQQCRQLTTFTKKSSINHLPESLSIASKSQKHYIRDESSRLFFCYTRVSRKLPKRGHGNILRINFPPIQASFDELVAVRL